ncbi:protein kilB [Streptomyces californicus]|uniref:protein kilB n=1 Tax=Streptomyces californicus TaxID=67351 RepID=UPI003829270D
MLNTVIALVSVLLGSITTGVIQHYLGRAARAEARDNHRRDRELEAVTAFAAGVAGHRRAMAVREDLRLSGADPEATGAARTESHATRSAIEAPRVQVSILVPSLAAAAEEAIRATTDLRGATDQQTLNTLRESALSATDRFIAAAARHFA